MLKLTHRHVGFLLAAVVCFMLGASLLPVLNKAREQSQLVVGDLGSNAPPELVLATTALGGFRSLLVTAIWWRAANLQQSSQFWELVQLYDWIGKLQPHMEEIWEFDSHNKAFNIVAEINDPQERWRWILRAIETLRDKGLRYNPRSYKIPMEIGRVFYVKVGREIDEYYVWYMQNLALMIEKDWGSGHPDLEALSKAPKDLDALKKDPKVADLIRLFRAEANIDLVEQYESVGELQTAVSDSLRKRFADPSYADARKLIESFRLARVIREQYKMEPARMLIQERLYAPMDWRLPEPHAIYWELLAIDNRLRWGAEAEKKDVIDARRIICFSIETLYRRGTLVYLGKTSNGVIRTESNLSFLEPYDRQLTLLTAYYAISDDRGAQTVIELHKNFLREATTLLYWAGQRSMALSYYNRLQKEYTDELPYTLDEYVLGQANKMVEEWGRQERVADTIENMLVQAYIYRAVNQQQLSVSYASMAQHMWNWYRDDFLKRREHATPESVMTFEQFKQAVTDGIFSGQYPNIPPEIVQTLREILSRPEAGSERTDRSDQTDRSAIHN